MVRSFLVASAVLAAMSGSCWAQQNISSCTDAYNYCVERTRRAGQSTSACETARQQCMRTGNAPDYDNPRNTRPVPVERR